jgi:hypothetical protein
MAVTAEEAVPKSLWSARNVRGSSDTTNRAAPRATRMTKMTKANNHTRKGEISFAAIRCFCKPYRRPPGTLPAACLSDLMCVTSSPNSY